MGEDTILRNTEPLEDQMQIFFTWVFGSTVDQTQGLRRATLPALSYFLFL